MAFRDDRDALLARADAADAEAERLRADNQRLRRDLERARDATPAPTTPTPAPPASPDDDDQIPPGTAATSPEVLADRALTPRAAEWTAALLVVAGAVAGATGAYAVEDSWIIFVGLALGTVGGLLVGVAIMAASRDRQRQWLTALPLPLDRVAYRQLLGVRRVRRRITLSAWVPSVLASQRAEISAAICAADAQTVVRWDGDRLELRSPTLTTWRQNQYGAAFHNVPVHRWFRRIVDRGLLPALDGHPVERLEIT